MIGMNFMQSSIADPLVDAAALSYRVELIPCPPMGCPALLFDKKIRLLYNGLSLTRISWKKPPWKIPIET